MKKTAVQPALFESDELGEVPEKLVVDAVAIYNEVADRVNTGMKCLTWRPTRTVTALVRRRVKAAIKDYGGLRGFRTALEGVITNDFLLGYTGRVGSHRDWKPTFGFFLQEKTVVKMLDGEYEEGRGFPTDAAPLSAQMAPADHWASALRSYKLRGFWNLSLGPRPEDPACRAPAAMLEACRKRLGIEVKARPVETEEERLAASIVLLRKYGRWDRANKAEERLAKLQGRPPVLVPAPEVAHMGMPERPLPDSSGRPRRGPVSEVDEHGRTSPADAEREHRMAHHALSEPPEYDGVPEAEFEVEEA